MSEILDRTAYQRPGSFSEATGRMSKNMNYFKINYVLFTAAVLAAFILYNPTSLMGFLCGGWGVDGCEVGRSRQRRCRDDDGENWVSDMMVHTANG